MSISDFFALIFGFQKNQSKKKIALMFEVKREDVFIKHEEVLPHSSSRKKNSSSTIPSLYYFFSADFLKIYFSV